ncbi:MAG: N-formylglutamate amidohydrolase [Gammaproteobacteria bacterium]|nr:N-formylglutamate amidohydrolase [Gammaproteobacteria bacterium]
MSKEESALESPGHDFPNGSNGHPRADRPPLLAADEPPPFEVLNAGSAAKIIVVCDHAGNRIPRSLNNLGLDEFSMRRHIAWDIGAADVARFLAPCLGAPTLLTNYSRLVVDCNRRLDDATAFRALSDGDDVPGNHLLTATEKQRRADAIYWPYHQAIASQVDRLCHEDFAPALISIHSFTPFFDNSHRPWEIGILWDNDPRIAVPLMKNLQDKGLIVGDNEPYSGRHPHDFTVDYHGEKRGLPHASIEIRQDLLSDAQARRRWATTLADCLQPILEQEELYRFFTG